MARSVSRVPCRYSTPPSTRRRSTSGWKPDERLENTSTGLRFLLPPYGGVRHGQRRQEAYRASSLTGVRFRPWPLRPHTLDNFFPDFRTIEATNPDYLERCARCFLKGLCEQCPAKSWSEHGTLDTPVEYLCQIAHVRARDLGLLSEGENAWDVMDWQARIKALETNKDEYD